MNDKLQFSVVIYEDFRLEVDHFGRAVVLPEHGRNRVWFETREAAERFRATFARALKVSPVFDGAPR